MSCIQCSQITDFAMQACLLEIRTETKPSVINDVLAQRWTGQLLMMQTDFLTFQLLYLEF